MTVRNTPVHHRLGAPLGVAALAGCACVAIWVGDPTTPGGPLPVCPTNAIFGVACPGCGAMRMAYSVLHLDFAAALQYNAVAFVAALFLLWAYGAWVYGRVVGRRITSWQHHRWAAAITLAVAVTWFVLRNIPVEPFSSLPV